MNSLPLFSCDLCHETNTASKIISFSCGHRICYPCVPFILLKSFREKGLSDEELTNETLRYRCLFCGKGKSSFKIETLTHFLEEFVWEKPASKAKSCEACEKTQSYWFCVDCGQDYCIDCLKICHLPNKKFVNHKLITQSEKAQNFFEYKRLECNCAQKARLQDFCKACSISICETCSREGHQNHAKIPILEVFSLKKDTIEGQKLLSKLLEQLWEVQEKTLARIQETGNSYEKVLENVQAEMIDLINKLKTKMKTTMQKAKKDVKDHFEIFQSAISILMEELSANELNTPNKIYQLSQFFTSDFLKNIRSSEPSISILPSLGLYPILKELLREMDEGMEKYQFTFTNLNLSALNENNRRICNFLSNPFEYIENKETQIILELDLESKYEDYLFIAAPIKYEKEGTFLIWGGGKDLKSFNLYSTNVTKGNGDSIISSPKISGCLSTLGVYSDKGGKGMDTIIYTGDSQGKIRFFNKKFEQIYEKQFMSEIISGLIFKDAFKEIENSDENLFLILAFYLNEIDLTKKKAPQNQLEIIDLKGNSVRVVRDQNGGFCSKISYFCDLQNRKTFICIGFSQSHIMIYDLMTEQFCRKFKTQEVYINSIDFLFDDEGNSIEGKKSFLIYAQDNYDRVAFANLGTERLTYAKFCNENESKIESVCVWNNQQKIILTIISNLWDKKLIMFRVNPGTDEEIKGEKLKTFPLENFETFQIFKFLCEKKEREDKEGIVLVHSKQNFHKIKINSEP